MTGRDDLLLPWIGESQRRLHIVLGALLTMAIAVGAAGTYVVTQSGVSTAVSEERVLARFRASVADEPPRDAPIRNDDVAPTAAPLRSDPVHAGRAHVATSPAASSLTPTPIESAPVDVEDSPSTTLPAEGVYTYSAEGYETVSFGQGRHDYPDRVHAALRHTRCGFDIEIHVLEEHVDRLGFCVADGEVALAEDYKEITFYGQTDSGGPQCAPPMGMLSAEAGVGRQLPAECLGAAIEAVGTATIVEHRTFTIDGQPVDTTLVEWVYEIRGDSNGHGKGRFWFDDSGLLVRMERESETTSRTVVGSVDHHEVATYELASLSARR